MVLLLIIFEVPEPTRARRRRARSATAHRGRTRLAIARARAVQPGPGVEPRPRGPSGLTRTFARVGSINASELAHAVGRNQARSVASAMMSNALAQREVVGVDARASLAGVKRSSEPRTSVLRARVDDFDSASSAGDDERHRNGLAAAVRASRRPVRPGAEARGRSPERAGRDALLQPTAAHNESTYIQVPRVARSPN